MLNGMQIIATTKDAVYLRLPRELWRPTGNACQCPHCKGADGYWDTLAVPTSHTKGNTAWTVHMPDPHVFNAFNARSKSK